jgi:mRNA interferase YafQ
MNREITYSRDFKADLKKLRSNKQFNADLLAQQIDIIASGGTLDAAQQNHKMAKQSRAEFRGTQNFHHKSDLVVIYRLTDDMMYLERIGNHSNLKLVGNKN